MTGENEEKSQSETEKHHQRPSSTCTPCLSMQKEKRTRENTGRGKDEIMGFKCPKRYKPQKRGQKHITRHHVTLELTRQKLHPETLHLKVVGITRHAQTPTQSCLEVGRLDNGYVRLCSRGTGTKHMSTMSCWAHFHHACLDNNYVNTQQSNFGTQIIFLKIHA